MNSYAYQLRARVAIIWTTLPVCANWHPGKPLTVNTEKTNKASLSSPLLYPPILLFFLLQTFLFQSYFIQIPSCVCLPHVAVCTLATWKVNVAMFYFETAFRSTAFLNKDRKYHHKSLQRTTNANKLCTVCYLTPNYATEKLCYWRSNPEAFPLWWRCNDVSKVFFFSHSNGFNLYFVCFICNCSLMLRKSFLPQQWNLPKVQMLYWCLLD